MTIASADGKSMKLDTTSATVVYKTARDRSMDHAPLVIFGVAATVLVLFMLRT